MGDMILTIVLAVVLLFLVGLLIWLVIVYNNIVRLRNSIDKSWANIDVLLLQRSSEIPNVVATVKGYMKHERETLETLTKARSFLSNAKTMSQKAAADNIISETIKTVFAVAENYPDLKAVENFLQLQKRITGLENELADRREFYNDSVMIYNTRIQSFPDLLVSRMMNFTAVELFKASEEDRQYVRVNL